MNRTARLFGFPCSAVLLAFALGSLGPGSATAGGTSVNLRATFAGAIVGGPYAGSSTDGILQISTKFGTLDLRFSPGSSNLEMSIGPEVAPGQCPDDRALPDTPFEISKISVFTYKEVILTEPCSGGPISGYGTSADPLNLLTMADGKSTYIQILIRFWVTGYPDYFDMRPNKTGVIESEFRGIVQVTASDRNPGKPGVDHWEFNSMACPLEPILDVGEANIYQTYPVGKKSSGSCNHGDFLVPLQIVIDRI